MKIPADVDGFRRWHAAGKGDAPPADVQVVTSDGHRIAAHSNVLASASSVLESLVYKPPQQRKGWGSERVVPILGVPSEVVFAFLQFVYSGRAVLSAEEGEEAMERHGVQLLVMAHKYRIGWLKRACEIEVGKRLKAGLVVDVLQIARLCDASMLSQKCLSFISWDFAAVQRSDGWRFVQRNDPRLELHILQFLQHADQRRRRWRRERADQETYLQLGEAMECLGHICTEGCTSVGPRGRAPASESAGPCGKFEACEGLQMLIRHYAACRSKKHCPHCKRMWQLFRLHSSLCAGESCGVPLCKQFKLKEQVNEEAEDATWRLLVKRVAVARVMSSVAGRKRPEELATRSHRRIR